VRTAEPESSFKSTSARIFRVVIKPLYFKSTWNQSFWVFHHVNGTVVVQYSLQVQGSSSRIGNFQPCRVQPTPLRRESTTLRSALAATMCVGIRDIWQGIDWMVVCGESSEQQNLLIIVVLLRDKGHTTYAIHPGNQCRHQHTRTRERAVPPSILSSRRTSAPSTLQSLRWTMVHLRPLVRLSGGNSITRLRRPSMVLGTSSNSYTLGSSTAMTTNGCSRNQSSLVSSTGRSAFATANGMPSMTDAWIQDHPQFRSRSGHGARSQGLNASGRTMVLWFDTCRRRMGLQQLTRQNNNKVDAATTYYPAHDGAIITTTTTSDAVPSRNTSIARYRHEFLIHG
jgi:hypothetical protein